MYDILPGVNGPPGEPLEEKFPDGESDMLCKINRTCCVLSPRSLVVFWKMMLQKFVPAGKLLALPLNDAVTVVLAFGASPPLDEDKDTQLLSTLALQLIILVPGFAREKTCVSANGPQVRSVRKNPLIGPTESLPGPDGNASLPTGATTTPRTLKVPNDKPFGESIWAVGFRSLPPGAVPGSPLKPLGSTPVYKIAEAAGVAVPPVVTNSVTFDPFWMPVRPNALPAPREPELTHVPLTSEYFSTMPGPSPGKLAVLSAMYSVSTPGPPFKLKKANPNGLFVFV